MATGSEVNATESLPSRAVAVSSFIAICAPVDRERYGDLVPGSGIQSCFDCGRYVVLSPSSIKRKPKWVVCHDCGTSLLAMHPGVSGSGVRDSDCIRNK